MAALDAPVRSARSPRGEEAADLMKIAADLMKIANLQLGVFHSNIVGAVG
jgi:hypothetical protein